MKYSPISNCLKKEESIKVLSVYESLYDNVVEFANYTEGTAPFVLDVFHTTMLQCMDKIGCPEATGIEDINSYVFVAFKHSLFKELANKRRKVDMCLESIAIDDTEDLNHYKDIVKEALFNRHIQKLGNRSAKVLDLSLSSYSAKEIAVQMGLKSDVVARQRVFKIKKKLRENIWKDPMFFEPALR